jgi:hypothetical protein
MHSVNVVCPSLQGLRAQSPDFDEEEAESIANENEEEDSMLQSVHLVSAKLTSFDIKLSMF